MPSSILIVAALIGVLVLVGLYRRIRFHRLPWSDQQSVLIERFARQAAAEAKLAEVRRWFTRATSSNL